jgi:PGF-pre-PGF domain-containing protein
VEVSGASLGETPEGTIEVWVKPANEWNYSSVYKKIVDKGSGRRNRALHYENGELCFSFHISGSGGAEDYRSACYSINLSANTWYHVAGTWGSKGVKLYLDGELVNTNPNYTGYGFTTSDLFWIGRAHCCPNQYTDAVFDEFRVSDVARTSFPEHKSSGTLTSITFTTSKPIISITPGWSASNVGGEYDVDADTASLWHFNEGSGTTAYDETVNNNDGTINGANWTTNSKFWDCKFRDYALDFDGVDNNVQIPDSVSLSPSTQLTAEAWIYPRSLGSMGIISKWHPGGPSDRSYVLHLLPSGALRGVISDGVSDYHIMETPEIIPTNKWTHVALVFDAGTMRIFINGHLSAENVTAAASIFDTTLPIVIGSIYNNEQVQTGLTYDWFGFDGVIDEVRISNVARTEFPQTNRLDIHVSADGGETWCVACNSTPVTSGCGLGTGNQLRYKAIFASDGLTSPVLHDITLAYEIDTIPPQSISNLQNTTATTWINWTWENPPDSDFNYTMIYIDSSFAENVSSSYYNLTNLLPNTSHTISTRTVDPAGNINETWVNQTTFTLAEIPELSASVVSSSQIDLSWKSDNPEGTFYELFEDSELIYSGTSTFFNHTGLSPSTTYHYKLRAKNGAGVYTENSSAEATTKSAIICGDGRCEGGETCSSCPSDCGRCPSGRKAYCGDGRCEGGEDCSSCPDDCGVCPTPTPTPAPTPTPLPADVSVLIKKDVGSLQAGESRVVSFEESDIWEIEINVRNAVSNVSIEIQQIIGKPNVSDAPGISYRYLNITAGNLTEEDLENATIRFRVNLSWIAENEIDEGKIALQRYNETKESWTELPTERIGKENESLLYEAVSLGFSIFAITGEMKIEAPTPVPTPIPTFIPTEAILPSPTPTPPEKVPSKLILGFEVVVALLALVIVYILRGFSRS